MASNYPRMTLNSWFSSLYLLSARITCVWLVYSMLGIEPRSSSVFSKYSTN